MLEVFERLPQTVDGFRDVDFAGSGMEVGRSKPDTSPYQAWISIWLPLDWPWYDVRPTSEWSRGLLFLFPV